MNTGFKWLNTIAFYAYALFLITAGGILGLFVPTWGPMNFEVYATIIFRQDLVSEAMHSALNQYRFMKSMEFGFGLYAILFHTEIYTQKKHNAYFLGIVLLGASIRAFSFAVDGRPHPAYVFFMVIELTIFLIIFLCSRKTLKSAYTP